MRFASQPCKWFAHSRNIIVARAAEYKLFNLRSLLTDTKTPRNNSRLLEGRADRERVLQGSLGSNCFVRIPIVSLLNLRVVRGLAIIRQSLRHLIVT